jgi:hypothetical protein
VTTLLRFVTAEYLHSVDLGEQLFRADGTPLDVVIYEHLEDEPQDFADELLNRGPDGRPGPTGPTGPTGPKGPPGQLAARTPLPRLKSVPLAQPDATGATGATGPSVPPERTEPRNYVPVEQGPNYKLV